MKFNFEGSKLTIDCEGESLLKMGSESFHCQRMEEIKEIEIINSGNVTTIGDGFLACCDELKQLDLIPLCNVTRIGDYFLAWCNGLEELDLTPLCNVTTIGDRFLYGCNELTQLDLSPVRAALKEGKSR